MKRKYRALSLVEILFVLGGLMILGSITLVGTRYALEKSREAHCKSTVRLLYTTLVDFKNDFGRYPLMAELNDPNCFSKDGCISGKEFFAEALGFRDPKKAILKPYLKEGFDGGAQDTYYYYYVQETDGQFVLVCVSLDGFVELGSSSLKKGFYCEGDGIGILPMDYPEEERIQNKEVAPEDPGAEFILRGMDRSAWKSKRKAFTNL